MSRDWRSYLADIATACEKVARFTAGMDRSAFFSDDRTDHAVVHRLRDILWDVIATEVPELRLALAALRNQESVDP